MSDYNFSKVKVGVIDLKSHNLFSILQAMKNIGYKTTVLNKPNQFKDKDIIILPGVGSFKYAMNFLKIQDYQTLLKSTFKRKKHFLGFVWVCNYYFQKVRSLEKLMD